MALTSRYPKSKARNFEKSGNSGPAKSWTSEGPIQSSKGTQLSRGSDTVPSIKLGKIPNKKG